MSLTVERNLILNNPATQSFLADAYYPTTKKQLPLVIFVHGYKGYKDWGTWDLLMQAIAEAGNFVVKFNFSHNGVGLLDVKNFTALNAFGENTYSMEMSDLHFVTNHFINRVEINQNNVTLIGHSRGGGIATLVANEHEKVTKLITLSGTANLVRLFPKGERFEKWKKENVFYVENKRTHQQMPHFFSFYEDFERNKQRFDIQHTLQHFTKPYLILHGSEDEAVPISQAYLLNEWAKNATLKIIKDATHTYGGKEPWTDLEMPIHLQMAADEIVNFLK